jgi:hypothetical protein
MPEGASSAAAAWVRPRSAHFDEPYAAWLGNGRIAPVLHVFTMAAPSAARRCGNAARIPRNGPRQLNRQLSSNPEGVSSASEARCSTPALLIRVVSDPNSSTVWLTAALHRSSDVTSSDTAATPSRPSTEALSSSSRTSHAATR